MISILNANFKSLPKDIINILDPIFLKLKIENCTMTKQNFLDYCELLFEVKIM